RDLIPYREGVYVLDVELYAGHMVRLERANALPAIIIRDLTSGAVTTLKSIASSALVRMNSSSPRSAIEYCTPSSRAAMRRGR
ncbi:hypothetical protein, partial [Bradyrhizobium uaiense]